MTVGAVELLGPAASGDGDSRDRAGLREWTLSSYFGAFAPPKWDDV